MFQKGYFFDSSCYSVWEGQMAEYYVYYTGSPCAGLNLEFEMSPIDPRLKGLALTLWEGARLNMDVSCNASHLRGLTSPEIVELLKVEVLTRRPLLHHVMSSNLVTSTKEILDRLEEDDLCKLISYRCGQHRVNTLSWAVLFGKSEWFTYLKSRLGTERTQELLLERDWSGDTALHSSEHSLEYVFDSVTIEEAHRILSTRGRDGLTVLAASIYKGHIFSFFWIVWHYHNEKALDLLLELSTIQDDKGSTAFHYAVGRDATSFLTLLMEHTYYLRENQEHFVEVLKIENDVGEISAPVQSGSTHNSVKPHADNPDIYRWALTCAMKNQYMLTGLPRALIISNSNNRPGAGKEALSLLGCLEDLGFQVDYETDLNKSGILSAIKKLRASEECAHGMLVAMMSHGTKGYIYDNDGEMVPLIEVEKAMTTLSDFLPKILILQCCQVLGEGNRMDASTQTDGHCQTRGCGTAINHTAEIKPGGFGLAGHPTSVKNSNNEANSGEETSLMLTSPTVAASNGIAEPASLVEETNEQTNMAEETGLTLSSPTEDPGPSDLTNYHESFAPTSPGFCVLSSSSPGRLSRRNLFIPALADALRNLKEDDSLLVAMDRASGEVQKVNSNQVPLYMSTMCRQLCIRNSLPAALKRMKEEGAASKDSNAPTA